MRKIYQTYIQSFDNKKKLLDKVRPKGQSFYEFVINYIYTYKCSSEDDRLSMDNLLVADAEYMNDGSSIIFPDNSDLVNLIASSSFSVDDDCIDYDKVPRSFSVSWPQESINGIRLLPTMVVLGIPGKDPTSVTTIYPNKTDDIWGQCVVGNISNLITRDIEASGDTYMGAEDDAKNMGEMVARLLVYMQACPDKVEWGVFPSDMENKKNRPKGVGYARCIRVNSHNSGTPKAQHFRSAHFRSYPLRKDGTRRKGVVMVKACVVGREVNPATVKS